MNENRQIIFLGNTPFENYQSEGSLKVYDKPDQTIKLASLPFNGKEYEFVFNKVTGKVVSGPDRANLHDYEYITLPKFALEGEQQLESYKTDKLNQWSRQGHWGVYFADSYMRTYLKEREVELDFAGDRFRLDVQREVYYEKANPANLIRLSDLYCAPQMGYELEYNPLTKNIWRLGDANTQCELFFLDQMVSYDPLGMAIKYNIAIGRLPKSDAALRSPDVLANCRRYSGPLKSSDLQEQYIEKTRNTHSAMKKDPNTSDKQTDYKGMLIIHGDLYQFNEQRNQLTSFDEPIRELSMQYLDKGAITYIGDYDRKKMNFADPAEKREKEEDLLPIRIPIQIIEEGDKLTAQEISDYNKHSLDRHQGYYVVDSELSDRLNGELPTMTLHGKNYRVDLTKAELVRTDNPKIKLRFNQCDVFEPSVILYSTRTHTQVAVKEHKEHLYPDVVGLSFPPLQEFDIVGRTLMSELPPTAMICEFPWKGNPAKIETLELSKINIRELNQRNRKQQEVERKADIASSGTGRKAQVKRKPGS